MFEKIKRLNFGVVAPSFLIIGAQKCGTTALHEYLIQHHKLIAPKDKELHFFDTFDNLIFKDYLNKFPRNYFNDKISFESTPRYLYYPGVAKNIYDFNPEMKFIVLLRDPVKRAYSAWNMYKQMGLNKNMVDFFKMIEAESSSEKIYSFLYKKKEFPSFEECISFELENELNEEFIEPSIIRRGYYKEQLDIYLKYFKIEQFLIFNSSILKEHTTSVLDTIASFLNISNFSSLELDLGLKHKREYSEKLDTSVYNKLSRHFKVKNQGLEELINKKLDWMS